MGSLITMLVLEYSTLQTNRKSETVNAEKPTHAYSPVGIEEIRAQTFIFHKLKVDILNYYIKLRHLNLNIFL